MNRPWEAIASVSKFALLGEGVSQPLGGIPMESPMNWDYIQVAKTSVRFITWLG